MKLSALYQIFLDCQLVTTDSRNCPEGSLFIALKGESFNGNAFAGKMHWKPVAPMLSSMNPNTRLKAINDIYS